MNYSLGIDIGTSKICCCVLALEKMEFVEVFQFANTFNVKSNESFERLQDPQGIVNALLPKISEFEEKYKPISIGISTQMHGILYLDKDGNSTGPLYTWQDLRGSLNYNFENTYSDKLENITGYKLPTGYGMLTHFVNFCKNQIPQNAVKLCTIGDYLAMKLTGEKSPIMHISNAHSLGLFDILSNDFDKKAVSTLNFDKDYLPKVTALTKTIGKTKQGTKVAVAIGDNQASFIGAVTHPENSILINIGTGSQISICTDKAVYYKGLELRPLSEDKYLLCGAALCGGRAYALLENFFRKITETVTGKPCENAYMAMAECYDKNLTDKLIVDTRFDGTRDDVDIKGSIKNLSVENFTPAHFIEGVLNGMAEELFNLFKPFNDVEKRDFKYLVCSGNGVRKNKALREILSKKFNAKVQMPTNEEEAALGAALFSNS